MWNSPPELLEVILFIFFAMTSRFGTYSMMELLEKFVQNLGSLSYYLYSIWEWWIPLYKSKERGKPGGPWRKSMGISLYIRIPSVDSHPFASN